MYREDWARVRDHVNTACHNGQHFRAQDDCILAFVRCGIRLCVFVVSILCVSLAHHFFLSWHFNHPDASPPPPPPRLPIEDPFLEAQAATGPDEILFSSSKNPLATTLAFLASAVKVRATLCDVTLECERPARCGSCSWSQPDAASSKRRSRSRAWRPRRRA
jgi:hypothetical protein